MFILHIFNFPFSVGYDVLHLLLECLLTVDQRQFDECEGPSYCGLCFADWIIYITPFSCMFAVNTTSVRISIYNVFKIQSYLRYLGLDF